MLIAALALGSPRGHGRQQAARQEEHDEAEQATEQQQADRAGVRAAQAGAREVGERLDDEGAEHRAPERAAAAEQRGQHDQHARDDVEDGADVEEGDVVGVDAARDAEEGAAEDERDQLVGAGRQAEAGGLVLVVLDGEQAQAELAAPDPGGDGDGQHEQGEQRVVERPVLVGQRPGRDRQGQALAAAGEARPDRRDDAEELQRGERDDDEVHAAGTPGDQAEDRRRERATRPPTRQPRNGETLSLAARMPVVYAPRPTKALLPSEM